MQGNLFVKNISFLALGRLSVVICSNIITLKAENITKLISSTLFVKTALGLLGLVKRD